MASEPNAADGERVAYAKHRVIAEMIARNIVGAEPARWCVGMTACTMPSLQRADGPGAFALHV